MCILPAHNSVHKGTAGIASVRSQTARLHHTPPRVQSLALLQKTITPLSASLPLPQQQTPTNPTINSKRRIMQLGAADLRLQSQLVHRLVTIAFTRMYICIVQGAQ